MQAESVTTDHADFIQQTIRQSIELKTQLLQQASLLTAINDVSNRCIDMYQRGNRLLIAGNGGSAADAQHIAAEFVCRFNFERPGLPAMALATNYSMITAAGNDYSFDDVFAREIEANGSEGDIFIGISTSGNSTNILKAIEAAKAKGIFTVGLAGQAGSIQQAADLCLAVPSATTPRIQECHILIGHIICEIVENALFSRD
ncbi:MAG: SIS domain-containing protein [Gammaproteobacteria bacterium]|nr:SIS domain-containing protein [Gammaproteobacteria bacterium]